MEKQRQVAGLKGMDPTAIPTSLLQTTSRLPSMTDEIIIDEEDFEEQELEGVEVPGIGDGPHHTGGGRGGEGEGMGGR